MTDETTLTAETARERINLSKRPFLLVTTIQRTERTQADVRQERREIEAKMVFDLKAAKSAEERAEIIDAGREAIKTIDRKLTATHLPLNLGGPAHERRVKLEEERARASYLHGLRVAPIDKEAIKKAWRPAPPTKLRKTRSGLKSFEQIAIVDRIKPVHLTNAGVIIDVLRGDLIKHNYRQEPLPAANEIVEHFLSKYTNECQQGIDRYLTRMAQEHVRLAADREALEAQLENSMGPDAEAAPREKREVVRRRRQEERRAAKGVNPRSNAAKRERTLAASGWRP